MQNRRAMPSMFVTLFLCVSARRAAPVSRSRGVFDVLEYGADPSGRTDSTAAIQSAIDALQKAGTGTLLIPAGTSAADAADAAVRFDGSLEQSAVFQWASDHLKEFRKNYARGSKDEGNVFADAPEFTENSWE